MSRFVSVEFDAICVTVHKISITGKETICPYIVRTFPKVSGNPHGPDFSRYCKYQLITFKPWEGEPSNAWGNETESDEINSYLIPIPAYRLC